MRKFFLIVIVLLSSLSSCSPVGDQELLWATAPAPLISSAPTRVISDKEITVEVELISTAIAGAIETDISNGFIFVGEGSVFAEIIFTDGSEAILLKYLEKTGWQIEMLDGRIVPLEASRGRMKVMFSEHEPVICQWEPWGAKLKIRCQPE